MTTGKTAFNRLDFDEARAIAPLVGFDVMTYARQKKSCGPGCTYLARDKRYFVTMLIKHIESLRQSQELPPVVLDWYNKARQAASEYREIEKRFGRIVGHAKT